MYDQKVIEKFKNPKHVGVIEDADAVGEEGNMKCGDVMKIYLKIKDNRVQDIKFQTYGCVAAIVSSDALCELAMGKTLEEVRAIKAADILKEIGAPLPQIKHHCSVLGDEALHNALDNYEKNKKAV